MKYPVFFLFILLLFSSCTNFYFRTAKKDGGVHFFRMLKVNGSKQAVLVRGTSESNPLLVFLHGGPGFPLMPFEPNEDTFRYLENHFTLVYWEQRGTGKSFSNRIPKRSMHIDQFIADAAVVIDSIAGYLNKDKVFIWGHSWGSGIAILFAREYPEKVHALVTTGQTVNPYMNERLGFEFVRKRAISENNRRALRQLQWIDTIPDNYLLQDALTIRRWVYHYGGIVKEQESERPYVDMEEIHAIMSAPEYSLMERLNILFSPLFSVRNLWQEMKSLDLMADAPELSVPVYFLLGRHDIIVSSRLAAEYFNVLNAPAGKELIWFESSAHRPHSEEQKKFLSVMQQIRNDHYKEQQQPAN